MMIDLLYLMGFIQPTPPKKGNFPFCPSQLHVTFLNSFSIPHRNLSDFVTSYNRLLSWHDSLHVKVSEPVHYFGENEDIPVRKVSPCSQEPFLNLQQDTLSLLHSYDGKEHHNYEYIPHVSNHSGEAVHVGRIEHLSLIHHSSGFGEGVQNLHNFYLK